MSSRRSIAIALVVVVLAFIGGVMAGVVGDRIYLMTHERIVPRGGMEFLGRHLTRKLDRALDLSDQQEAQVKAIIARRSERIVSLEDRVHDTIHEEFAAAHKEIEAVLTPQQLEKFRRMQQRWHGRHHKR